MYYPLEKGKKQDMTFCGRFNKSRYFSADMKWKWNSEII
jgi:hypothetical protein